MSPLLEIEEVLPPEESDWLRSARGSVRLVDGSLRMMFGWGFTLGSMVREFSM